MFPLVFVLHGDGLVRVVGRGLGGVLRVEAVTGARPAWQLGVDIPTLAVVGALAAAVGGDLGALVETVDDQAGSFSPTAEGGPRAWGRPAARAPRRRSPNCWSSWSADAGRPGYSAPGELPQTSTGRLVPRITSWVTLPNSAFPVGDRFRPPTQIWSTSYSAA